MKRKVKSNTIRRIHHFNALVAMSVAVVIAAATGLYLGYDSLRDIWLKQFEIEDMATQVSITSGKMVKSDVIASIFGIKPGANLATIDYTAKRAETLKRVPNLRSIEVVRTLPGRITITAEERVPIARIWKSGTRGDSGRVVDSDGMVFLCSRGTKFLPVIRENSIPGVPPGKMLDGRMRAALSLIDACRDAEFQEIGILHIDISHTDFLLAILSDSYSQLKIAWQDMDENTPAARASLVRQLTNLTKVRRNYNGDGAVIWNATDYTTTPGVIYANKKGAL